MTSNIAYIGMGSNLSGPIKQVQIAYRSINEIESIRCIALSPLYQSKAVGPGEQPDYINAVAKLSTSLTPLALLDALQGIEQQQKRIRQQHWGPRTIDLDILLYNQISCNSERLVLPHPHMTVRNFVLAPLLDIEPDLTMPSGQTVRALLTHCGLNDLELMQAT